MSDLLPTILVVDDDLANIELITFVLHQNDYKVISTSKAEETISMAKKYAPDLILLDVVMPDTDGFEVIEQLKKDPETSPIPVIFLTALKEGGDTVRGFELGAVDYVNKPFIPEVLIARVNTHISINTLQQNLSRTTDLLETTGRIARVGGWELDMVNNVLYWSKITKEIHEVPEDYDPQLSTAINYYKEGTSRETITQLVAKAIETGEEYDAELQLVTAKDREIWVRAKGRAEYENGQLVRLLGTFQDITETVIFRKAFEEANEQFQTAFEIANIAICQVSIQGEFVKVNDEACRFFGFPANELEQMHFRDVTDTNDLVKSQEYFMKLVAGETDQIRFVKRYRHSSGRMIWGEVSSSVVRDSEGSPSYLFAYILDITARKEAEESLEQYKNIVSGSQDMLALINRNFEYLAVNESYSSTFELPVEEVVGCTPADLFGADFFEKYIEPNALHCLAGNHVTYENWMPFPSSKKFMEINYHPHCNEEGNVTGFVVVGRDKTERKRIEEQLRRSEEVFTKELEIKVKERTEELEAAQNRLALSLSKERKLGELKSHFVATASHQFRTPLTVIQSNMGVLSMQLERVDEETRSKFTNSYNRIRDQIEKMTSMMDDVLILGKLNGGSMKPNLEPIDLVNTCSDLVTNYNDIQDDDQRLQFNWSGEKETVMLDVKLIEHAISNLLSNALKYSKGAQNPEMYIDFQPDAVQITIRDYGIGIPPHDVDHLFEPFYRASNVTEFAGTGLGSAIAKEYVELNGGSISVESKLGEGSNFTIVFDKNKDDVTA